MTVKVKKKKKSLKEKCIELLTTEKQNVNMKILIGFLTGLIFSPFSWGLQYYIVTIILFEITVFYLTRNIVIGERFVIRALINYASLSGYIIGRLIYVGKI